MTRRQILRAVAAAGATFAATACSAVPFESPPPTRTSSPTATQEQAVVSTPSAAAGVPTPVDGARPPTRVVPTFTPPSPTPTRGPATVTGRLTILQWRDFNSAHNDYVAKLIQDFAQGNQFPLEIIDVDAYASPDQLLDRLTSAVAANNPPDAMLHVLPPVEVHGRGIAADVSGVVRTVTQRFGETTPGSRWSALLAGQWRAIPFYVRAGGYYVRKSGFAMAQIDVPGGLATFDQLRQACLAAVDPARPLRGWGLSPRREGRGDALVAEVILAWGGQLTDETGKHVLLDRSEFRDAAAAALTWLRETYTNAEWTRMLPAGVHTWDDAARRNAFLSGTVLLTADSGTLFSQAVADKNQIWEDTYLIPSPKGNGPRPRSRAGVDEARWFIFQRAKNREAAETLVELGLSEQHQREIFRLSPGYAYPSYEWGWDDPAITASREAQHVTDALRTIAWDQTGFTGPAWPGPPSRWVDALTNAGFWSDLFGGVLNGQPIEEALASAHERAEAEAEKFALEADRSL